MPVISVALVLTIVRQLECPLCDPSAWILLPSSAARAGSVVAGTRFDAIDD